MNTDQEPHLQKRKKQSGSNAPESEKHTQPLTDTRKAKIRCLAPVKARGFTFSRGKVVPDVPMAHAEYLVSQGQAEILEVRA